MAVTVAPADPAALAAALAAHGYAVIDTPARDPDEPWGFVEALIGARPRMVERQPIRPRAGGRSIASTMGDAALHTDSQDYLGAPPSLQVMICRRAAAAGGHSRLVDGQALLARLERDDPALAAALVEVPRRHAFYFGDVVRPTVVRVGDRVQWTCSPQPPADPIGHGLARALARAPVIELAIAAGQTLVVDNHRMLHGRGAFADPERHFVRLLAWLGGPRDRLDVVLALLTGVPPARLAAQAGIAEAELYAWRSRALAAARAALADG